MILCVEKSAMKEAPEVQKNVDLKDLLENHTRYIEPELIERNDYVPLNFAVSVRSAYSNLVLETPVDSEFKRYYVNLTNVEPLPHKGYDLVMYLASIGIIQCINYSRGFDDVMMKTQFCPIGLYNSGIIHPIIFSTVILKDDTVDIFKSYLKEGYDLVPIQNMKRAGNFKPLLDTLILVKEESNSEQ